MCEADLQPGDRSLTSDSQEAWDVIVIGAGPAGSAAAITTARSGLRVLLLDAKRFPRHKVCGGCLNQVSIGILRDLVGAKHPLWEAALPVHSFRLTHAGRQFGFSMPEGCAVDRAGLDAHLVEAAVLAGAVFRAPVLAKLGEVDGGFRRVKLSAGDSRESARARLVVIASGLDNRVVTSEDSLQHTKHPKSRVGVEAIFPRFPESLSENAIHMVVGQRGYVGLTRIAGNRLHVAAAVDKSPLQALGPKKLTESILKEAGASPLPIDQSTTWRGTLPLTSRAKRLGIERVLLVGDSAGYVEPFTGEGIRWALQSGTAIGAFAKRASGAWQESIVDDWEAWYAEHVLNDQRLCRLLAWGLKGTVARWFAHHLLSASPALANRIIAKINLKAE